MATALIVILAIVLILVIVGVASGIFTVQQQTTAVIERFGKFHRTAGPGLHAKIPIVDRIVNRLDLRVTPLNVPVETKTADNVFVNVVVAVQYCTIPGKEYEAHYKLQNHTAQITSYVFDVVRANVPKMNLDDVFVKKDEIADAVKSELDDTMDDFGYQIVKSLVTDIDPDANVKASMNEINAAQRQRVAAAERGEADKILRVKQAEADKQSKILQGEGVAGQRKAIADGLSEAVKEVQTCVQGASTADVMNMVLMTQYFDTLKDLASQSNTNTVLLPHSPAGMADISDQIRNAMITAGAASQPSANGATVS